MKQLFQFFALLGTFAIGTLYAQNNMQPLVIGDQLTLSSRVLGEERVVNVYLPAGYHPDSTKTYPVIYVLDGSMWEDFMPIAGIIHFESYSWINRVPESIVVGISNIDRKRDFTFPTTIEKDKADYPTTGGSEAFIGFLELELIPTIEDMYPTKDQRTIIGQSLGGLLATEILFAKPQLFTHYLIVSPSLWWDAESLLDKMPAFTESETVHVAVGKEHKIMIRDARKLAKLLKGNPGVQPKVSFDFLKTTDHTNNMHEAVYFGLRHLYEEQ